MRIDDVYRNALTNMRWAKIDGKWTIIETHDKTYQAVGDAVRHHLKEGMTFGPYLYAPTGPNPMCCCCDGTGYVAGVSTWEDDNGDDYAVPCRACNK